MTRIDTSQVEQIDYCFNTLMLSETYIVLSLFLVHLNEVGGTIGVPSASTCASTSASAYTAWLKFTSDLLFSQKLFVLES